nr:hypothetical protein [Haladaptatus sp. W1]
MSAADDATILLAVRNDDGLKFLILERTGDLRKGCPDIELGELC